VNTWRVNAKLSATKKDAPFADFADLIKARARNPAMPSRRFRVTISSNECEHEKKDGAGMTRRISRNHFADRARSDSCPACGGMTERPYLDCAACRAARRRLPPGEREQSRVQFPGLDGDELAARRRRNELD
jgi:hypothetical protein